MQANLSKYKEFIEAAYKRHSSLECLIDPLFIHEGGERPTFLPQSIGKLGSGFVAEPEASETPNVFMVRSVVPTNIGSSVKLSGLPERYPIEVLCEQIGSFLAQRELVVLRDGLVKYCGKKFRVTHPGALRTSDLQEPTNWIHSNQYSADRLLIPLKQENNLFTEQQLMAYASNVRDRTTRFVGRIGALEVYWMHDLTNSGLMFESLYMSFYKTSLDLRFDNEQFIFDQWCASAPTNELSTAMIEI